METYLSSMVLPWEMKPRYLSQRPATKTYYWTLRYPTAHWEVKRINRLIIDDK
jgi:hypothetical protein